MGVSKENIKYPPRSREKTNEVDTSESIEIPWRNVLKDILGSPSDRTDSQRSWADMALHLRELFPETQWIFVRQENKETNEGPMIQNIQRWLEALIHDPEWPLPERVIISAEGEGKNRCWRVAFPRKQGALPRCATSISSLTIVPWGDEHSHGWKIHNIAPYSLNKAGEA